MAQATAAKGGRIVRLVARLNNLAQTKGPIIWKYASQELKPPTVAEIPQLKKEIAQLISKGTSGAWKELTTYDVLLNAVVVWEIFCWYCVGEIIGKRKVSGYDAGFGSYATGPGGIEPLVLPNEFCNFPPEKK